MAKRIAIVVGTRPEVIKMAPVYYQLAHHQGFEVDLISSGQHRLLLEQALDAFEIRAKVNLELMTEGQSLSQFMQAAIVSLERVFAQTNYDAVLVHGDTSTTLAAALSAFYQRIPVGHVEAGMRTGNMESPFPEEMNRRLVAPLCRWHFAPLEANRRNLIAESIPGSQCFVTGNTVVDSLHWIRKRLRAHPPQLDQLRKRLSASPTFFDKFLAQRLGKVTLVTSHRRENQGMGLKQICLAIHQLIERHPDLAIVFPVHPNPSVRQIVFDQLAGVEQVLLSPPLNYPDFIWLMERCYLIISDSGGIQGEAMTLNKPLLVTRETTEYPEGFSAGGCYLVGTQASSIFELATKLICDQAEYSRCTGVENPYGDGLAAQRIVQILHQHFYQ